MIKLNTFSRLDALTPVQGSSTTSSSCNWFCRNIKNRLKDVISFIGVPFGGLINEVLDYLGTLRDSELFSDTQTLSDLEASNVESWIVNVFFPKYEMLIRKGNDIFYGNLSLQDQVKGINEINNELAITKEYLKWDNPKLSVEAKKIRNEYCENLISVIEKIIFDIVSKHEKTFIASEVTVESTTSLLAPIVTLAKFKAVATNYELEVSEDEDVIENPVENIEKSVKYGSMWVWLLGGFVGWKLLKK